MSPATSTKGKDAPAASFFVGQKLWFDPTPTYGTRQPVGHEVEVTKVGRKWIEFATPGFRSVNRFDRETLVVDGGGYSSPGRIWMTRAECQEEDNRFQYWSRVRRLIQERYEPPAHLNGAELAALVIALRGPDATP